MASDAPPAGDDTGPVLTKLYEREEARARSVSSVRARLEDVERIRRRHRQLRGDERYQRALLTLRRGRRTRAAFGLAGCLGRDAVDRVWATPAWLASSAWGYDAAALRVRGLDERLQRAGPGRLGHARAWWSVVRGTSA